jgi:type VI secretion system protein ImpL
VVAAVASGTAAVTRAGIRGTLEHRYRQDVLRECVTITGGRYPFVAGSTSEVPLADFGRLFGHGGVFDAFFKDEIQALVDTSRTPWTWRSDSSGQSVGPSLPMLRQFEAAQRIRDAFFRPGSQEPELRFRVTMTDLDASATRVALEIDGQRFEYFHGPARTGAATWPGPKPGLAVVTFEDRTAERPNRAFEGPWAWFRLLDAADVERETDVNYALRFRMGGHEALIRLEAASIRNPFAGHELQNFQCESRS